MNFKLLCFVLFFGFGCLQAQVDSTGLQIDSIQLGSQSIFGNEKERNQQSGSSFYIDPKDLEKYVYTDVSDILFEAPGVIITEEDGYGLRPNIGFRGSSPERSAGISLMEDRVLIAPAPYASPSAYYFPTAGRMYGVEILKGSSQIKYGPNTTSGVLNFVSTPIKNKNQFRFNGMFGSNNTYQTHAYAGTKIGDVSFLGEFFGYGSDGFKKLSGNDPTGFDKQDYLAKVRWDISSHSDWKHHVDFKLQYSKETSYETYLGITEEDFNINPYQRYSASKLDKMSNDHQQYQATYFAKFKDQLEFTVDVYLNEFKRNWYKIQTLDAGGGKASLFDVLNQPNNFADELAVLKGTFEGDNTVYLRNNNRAYTAAGIQLNGSYHFKNNATKHSLVFGARYHYDDEDRIQSEDAYLSQNYNLLLQEVGAPGSESNRISFAQSFSSYVEWFTYWKKFIFSVGIRMEDIGLTRNDYGKTDPNRTGADMSRRENNLTVWLPGGSVLYKINPSNQVFFGAYKGFATPGTTPDQDAEESWNYELGFRHQKRSLNLNATLFFNDYENLLGSDAAAVGGPGNNELYNAGAADVYGLELYASYDFLKGKNHHSLPVSVSYSYTHTEFKSSFESEVWGDVTQGNGIPYIPNHIAQVQVSYGYKKFSTGITANYKGKTAIFPSSNDNVSNENIDAYLVLNAFAQYELKSNFILMARAENLLDEVYATSWAPAGLRPGLPFNFSLGLRVDL